jgi:ATP-binding cassette, subfamily B, bacterial
VRLRPRYHVPLLRIGGARPWQFVLLTLLSFVGGLAEAAVLVLIVQIALRLAQDAKTAATAGIFSTQHMPLSELFWIGAALCIVRAAAFTSSSWLAAWISTRVSVNARKELFGAFIRARWSVQSKEAEGRLQDLATNQMGAAAAFALTFSTVLTSLMNFLTLIVSAIVVNAIAAAVMVVIAILLFVGLRPLSMYGKKQSRAQSLGTTEYGRSISQAVNLALETRVFHVGEALDARLAGAADSVASSTLRGQFIGRLVPTAYQSVALVLVLGALWFLYLLNIGPIAGIGAVVILLVRSLSYGQLVQGGYNDLNFYLPYASRVEAAIEEYRAAELRGGPRRLESIERLELDRVGFSYDGVTQALTDVSFAVERGEIVGIAGPSGAGKSTLIEILLRLREPTRGSYLINGLPAVELDIDSWYSRLAIVRQDPRLVTGSVAENIRFLRDGIADADVIHAATLAHLHEEVTAREGGYAASIGERGTGLSGGQRQRLTIARALVGGPELFVLDEPTSALDLYAESVIHETLEGLRGRAFVFVVAHRLSTLRICDRIMVLERGRLAAFEAPAVLASKSAFFKRTLELSRLD